MRILFYQDLPSINSTLLTWTLVEELRLRGHTVHYGKQPLLSYYDWVHGAGQDSWGAIEIAKELGAKCHIHLEGVAYWRMGTDNAIDWGYEQNHSSEEIEMFRRNYQNWMSAAYEANSCSINGVNQLKTVEDDLFKRKSLPNCHIISCGADNRYARTLPDWDRENYMITVSRLEPNKKVFMIAEALMLLKKHGVDVPLWVIVGYGTSQQIQRLINILGVEIKFKLIPCFGAEKWRWIKRARLMLCGWMGIPPAEGLLCDTPVLSFDHPDIVEMYGDAICFAEDNNIKEYAEHLAWMLDYPTVALEVTKQGKAKLLRGDFYACTQETLAKYYSERIFI